MWARSVGACGASRLQATPAHKAEEWRCGRAERWTGGPLWPRREAVRAVPRAGPLHRRPKGTALPVAEGREGGRAWYSEAAKHRPWPPAEASTRPAINIGGSFGSFPQPFPRAGQRPVYYHVH
ncbi:hypothetical protein E2C01_062435 [Portunus trituberculatus]|uniref:Uncharacterized protein n=1 Tax=Portunus trituberculatus TaxID=210409 RepID=A0A5B7HHA5_PORTR|nr:hypothetical protein [Portunus trituberculatus]